MAVLELDSIPDDDQVAYALVAVSYENEGLVGEYEGLTGEYEGLVGE